MVLLEERQREEGGKGVSAGGWLWSGGGVCAGRVRGL